MSKLELTAYRPNLKDPRVQKRLVNVLAWCDLHLSPTSPEPIHHDEMRAVFGTATNDLTKWLRANLLIQHGVYVPGIKSYGYLLNESGADKLRAMSQQHMVTTSASSQVETYPELATLSFTYSLKSDRYWHRLQNIKRERKADFWRPYLPFNYDIDAAAPTLLLQMALNFGLPAILGRGVQDYLSNKAAYRGHVAELTGCSLNNAKRIINSLFNGAKLGENERWSIFNALKADREAMRRLIADQKIRSLRASIKQVWRGIGQRFEVKSSTAKWGVYFRAERRVLEVIRDELVQAGVPHFTEHDGFRAGREIDVEAMQQVVKSKTGFEIKLSRTRD
jgi:hypothetical protein